MTLFKRKGKYGRQSTRFPAEQRRRDFRACTRSFREALNSKGIVVLYIAVGLGLMLLVDNPAPPTPNLPAPIELPKLPDPKIWSTVGIFDDIMAKNVRTRAQHPEDYLGPPACMPDEPVVLLKKPDLLGGGWDGVLLAPEALEGSGEAKRARPLTK